jgi:hypothetical protein
MRTIAEQRVAETAGAELTFGNSSEVRFTLTRNGFKLEQEDTVFPATGPISDCHRRIRMFFGSLER